MKPLLDGSGGFYFRVFGFLFNLVFSYYYKLCSFKITKWKT